MLKGDLKRKGDKKIQKKKNNSNQKIRVKIKRKNKLKDKKFICFTK